MGTVEFTGLVMMQSMASGQLLQHSNGNFLKALNPYFAAAVAKVFTIDAFVLNRSSLVIPMVQGTIVKESCKHNRYLPLQIML